MTIPLAFLVGIVGSLLVPDAAAAAKHDQLAHQMHMGAAQPR